VIVTDDIEVWLLFAPFWILGTAALVGGIWHIFHATMHTRRAQAAGHVRRAPLLSRGLAWHELPEKGRHHMSRALIALAAFFALCLLGIGVGVAVGLIVSQ